MKKRDIEKLFKQNGELAPRAEAKEEILSHLDSELAVKTALCDDKKKKSAFSMKKWVSLAACFMMVAVMLGGFLGVYSEAYQTVYIDVNPSVAIELNRFEKVTGVEYLNEDARAALEGVNLRGYAAEDAVAAVIDAYDSAGYFEGEAELYISADPGKNKNAAKLLEKLCKCAEEQKGNKNYSVNKGGFTAEDKENAKEEGLSPAKYSLINEILEINSQYTFDELKDMKMSELKKLVQGEDEKQENGKNENGKDKNEKDKDKDKDKNKDKDNGKNK